jgi:hypothetical protein
MSNEFEGGNENTYDSSPESVEDGSDLDNVGSSANEPAMSAHDFLSRRQEIKEKQARNSRQKPTTKMTSAESDDSVAEADEEASEEDVSQTSKTAVRAKAEQRENPKFQQRIDKLTARYHESERKTAERDVQIEKLMKATEILQNELERVSKVARLDPQAEKIRELELQREVDKFANSLNNRQDEIYSKSVNDYQIQSRADEILDEVSELAEEYDLASPEEILIAMRDHGKTANQAAREIHNARLQKAQKRISVKHPSSVSKNGSQGSNNPEEPYRGADSIKKFLLQRMAERGGKAE